MKDFAADGPLDKLAGESTHFALKRATPPPAMDRRAWEPPPPPPPAPLLLFDTIRRRKFSMALTCIVSALAGGAPALSLTMHYVATASLMVEDRKPSLTGLPTLSGGFGTDSVAARTQVDLLRAPDLAAHVAARLRLTRVAEFARAINPPPSAIDRLSVWMLATLRPVSGADWWPAGPQRPLTEAEALQAAADLLRDKTTVLNDGRSYVIDIQARSEDADLSAAIANAYVDAYLALKTHIKSEALRRANSRFDARLDGLAERARAAEQAVAQFRAEHGLIEDRASATGVTVAGQQLAQINADLITASNERARLDATMAQVRAAQTLQNKGAAPDIADLPEVLASPLIQRLHEQEAELAGREANLAMTRGSGDPDLLSLRAAHVAISRKITVEVSRVVASLGSAAAAARAREAALRDALARVQQQMVSEGNSSVRLLGLQNAAATARSVYTANLDRAAQTANEVDLQEPDAVLVSPAVPPLQPVFPRRVHLLILDLAAAPMLAVFVALLQDRLRRGLRSAEAIEALTGRPCLGFVPARGGPRWRQRQNAADFANAVAALPAALGRTRPRVLLLTAALPGEGTSVLAEALARGMAENGARVLLVICGRGFAPPALPMPNLEIITATPPALPKAPRGRYDTILLDTPAVLATSLTLPLAAMAEATILVVRFGHTPAAIVARAAQTLRRHGGHLLGTVVTRVDRAELSDRDGSERTLDRYRRAASRTAFTQTVHPVLARRAGDDVTDVQPGASLR